MKAFYRHLLYIILFPFILTIVLVMSPFLIMTEILDFYDKLRGKLNDSPFKFDNADK